MNKTLKKEFKIGKRKAIIRVGVVPNGTHHKKPHCDIFGIECHCGDYKTAHTSERQYLPQQVDKMTNKMIQYFELLDKRSEIKELIRRDFEF